MFILGKILGWLTIALFFMAVLNYPVKAVFRRYFAKSQPGSKARQRYQAFMKFIVGGHRIFAILATVSMIAHFIIQFSNYGLRISGLVTGALMITQGSLGAFGTYIKKRKRGGWFYIHRVVAALLILSIILHVLKV